MAEKCFFNFDVDIMPTAGLEKTRIISQLAAQQSSVAILFRLSIAVLSKVEIESHVGD